MLARISGLCRRGRCKNRDSRLSLTEAAITPRRRSARLRLGSNFHLHCISVDKSAGGEWRRTKTRSAASNERADNRGHNENYMLGCNVASLHIQQRGKQNYSPFIGIQLQEMVENYRTFLDIIIGQALD
jgi:hypothetical protein